MRKKAFSLAEVLITLFLIGIVAVMVVPLVFRSYTHNQWKVGLMKAYNVSSEALSRMRTEDGENIWDRYGNYTKLGGHYNDFATPFLSYFNGTFYNKTFYTFYPLGIIHRYTGGNLSGCTNWSAGGYTKQLNDGMLVGASVNSSTIVITIDVNGQYKGPNTYGKDVFAFYVDPQKDRILPVGSSSQSGYALCSKSLEGSSNNGMGCAYWALLNKCPDDETKNYWDGLP